MTLRQQNLFTERDVDIARRSSCPLSQGERGQDMRFITRALNSRDAAANGFTLLELMVAMTMVAILAVSLFASMRIAFQSQASAEAAVASSRTADMAMEFIRSDLQNALPPHDPSKYTIPYQKLAGTCEGTNSGGTTSSDGDIIFFSTADMKDHPSANGEVKEIELTTEVPTGTTQRCLVRKCCRNLTVNPLPVPDEEIICRNISGFNLRFFDGSNWNDVWDSTQLNNELPAAVEVTLIMDTSTDPKVKNLVKYVRIFQMACSNATYDSALDTGSGTSTN
jgi:prepilin-type N-terminal cleavage/methylation domain-containing protein